VNADFMQAFYGITPAQSSTALYPVYTPGAGWRDIRGNASVTYFFSKDWSATVALTLRSLQGAVTRSPLVREDTPLVGVLAVDYSF